MTRLRKMMLEELQRRNFGFGADAHLKRWDRNSRPQGLGPRLHRIADEIQNMDAYLAYLQSVSTYEQDDSQSFVFGGVHIRKADDFF